MNTHNNPPSLSIIRELALGSTCLSIALLTGCGGSDTTAEWDLFYSTQEESIEWQRTIDIDSYGDLIATGQTITIGATVAERTEDVLIAKHDNKGNLIWASSFNLGKNSARSDETTTDATMDSDGNTYIVGTIYRPEDSTSIYASFLLKTNRFGGLDWSNLISDVEKTRDVEIANNLIYTGGDFTKVFDTNGNLVLEIDHGSANVWNIEVDSNGNIYSAGYAFTTKHDSSGNLIWQTDNPEGLTHATGLVVLTDESVVIAHLIANEGNIRVSKISSTGSTSWTKSIDDPTASAGALPGLPLLALDRQENILVINSNAQGRKISKLNARGDTIWTKSNNDGVVRQIKTDAQNNIYIYGSGIGEKFDASGNSLKKIEAPSLASNTTGAIAISGDDIFVSSSIMNNGTFDLYLAKYINE